MLNFVCILKAINMPMKFIIWTWINLWTSILLTSVEIVRKFWFQNHSTKFHPVPSSLHPKLITSNKFVEMDYKNVEGDLFSTTPTRQQFHCLYLSCFTSLYFYSNHLNKICVPDLVSKLNIPEPGDFGKQEFHFTEKSGDPEPNESKT